MTISKKFRFYKPALCAIASAILMSSLVYANNDQVPNVSAKDLNQNVGKYVGKKVALTGQVDRVLGNGGYIISDSSNTKDPAHRVMIFTSTPSSSQTHAKQQAGMAAQSQLNLKEGDTVQMNGKVEQFIVSSEVDSFSPKSDTETINESSAAVPVIVIQPGNMLKG